MHRGAAQRGGVAAGCLIAIVVAVVVIAVGGYFVFKAGTDIVAEEVRLAIRDHPVVREHVGVMQDIRLDIKRTGAIEGDDVFVFRFEGTKANGELEAQIVTGADGREQVLRGTLRLDSGEVVPFEGVATEGP